MPTTPIYGWSTPVDSDPNDVPVDMANFASQVEGTVSDIEDRTAYAEAAGRVAAGQRSGASYTHAITFPAGRFTQPPIVTAVMSNAAGGVTGLMLVADDSTVTTSGASLIFLPVGGGTFTNLYCTASWHAVQMTSTTAAG